MTTTNDIDAIRKLTDAATDGPWVVGEAQCTDEIDAWEVPLHAEGPVADLAVLRYQTNGFQFPHAEVRADAEFIATARTLVPALCDEVEQLRAQVMQFAGQLGSAHGKQTVLRGQMHDTEAELDKMREQVFAQKPVIEAAEAWAEMRETDDVTPTEARKLASALHDAVEQYRLMDLALTSAREEKVAEPSEPQYLIWSNHHQAWWAPNSRGYRSNVNDAGRYTLADTQKEMSRGCDCCQVPEVPVLASLTAGAGDRKLRSVIAAATKAAIEAGQVNRYYAPVIEVAS